MRRARIASCSAPVSRCPQVGLAWKLLRRGCVHTARHGMHTMFVSGVGTASPARRYTRTECWEAFRDSDWFSRLGARAHAIAQAVLLRDNGMRSRWLAVDSLDEVFHIDPDTLYRRFVANAPSLAATAARNAIAQADLDVDQVDAMVVSTCTGNPCPGLSGYVIERLNLRADVLAFDLVGHGCAAALPNWQLASALLHANQCRHVLSVCVEVCSAAMYLDGDPGVLISASLFGDGAGAAILSRAAARGPRRVEWKHTGSLVDPDQRCALRFEQRDGMLRNILARAVPKLAAKYAGDVLDRVLSDARVDHTEIRGWIVHSGGRDVLLALQKRFDTDADDFRYSTAVLNEYGNLSSAFVYVVLQAAFADDARGGWWWLFSFGAGFSCHGALLQVE